MPLEAVQLKPPQSEELALWFETLAAEARAGDITGCSAIITRPGSRWQTRGFNDGNCLEMIGRHFMAMTGISEHITDGSE